MILTRRILLTGLAASFWSFAPARAAQGPFALRAQRLGDRLGYNGASPGPLLRVTAGAALKLAFVNELAEPTTLAFPGLRGTNAALLAGKGRIASGDEVEVDFVPPDPGFNIYGALIGPDPQGQLARGLFGPLVVEEPNALDVDLETIALFSDDAGALAVNGVRAPTSFSAPPGARVRLRLANAASERVLQLAVSGARPTVIAVDGQPSEPFEPRHDQFPVAPGARFELLFDMPADPGAVGVALAPDTPLLVFNASGAPARGRPPFAGLPANKALPGEIALERSRRIVLAIAGQDGAWRFEGPAPAVKRGEPVTLTLANKTAVPRTIRLTGHVARLLHELDDGWEPYWRDIFVVAPGKTVHAAFVADNLGAWPLEAVAAGARNAGLTTIFTVG